MQLLDLFDASRQRSIPVALYAAQAELRGWILFSVGFGGARSGYAYLGRAWSQLGFNVVVIEHVGSNAAILKEIYRPGMRQAELSVVVGERVRDVAEMLARPQDLLYARTRLCGHHPWVGVAGHSYGSYTALAALGAEVLLPDGAVHRFSSGLSWAGAVLLSVQPPDSVVSTRGLSEISVSCFMLTGTRDNGMPAGVSYQQRIQSFHALPCGHKYLAVLESADHMSFAAIGLAVAPVVETVARLTGQFWQSLRSGQPPCWPDSLPLEVQIDDA